MEELKNKIIGVFFGGQNPEHEISVITGEFVIAELKKMGYKTIAIYIDKNGAWFSDEKILELKFFKGDYKKELGKLPNYYFNLSSSQKKIMLQTGNFLNKKEIAIDFIFPAFHGLGGEDGTIQGLAELFHVPYSGCGIYSSAVSIDKCFTKKLLKSLNILTSDFLIFNKQEWANNADGIVKKIKDVLEFPVFVKPARTGSSIGISKAKSLEELKNALNLAFYYDVKAIVENSVENIIDLTCAVLSDGKKIIASEVQESLFESDLFDYSVKYLEDGGAQTGNAESNLVIPANIEDKFANQIKSISKQIFKEIDANGTIRVDFLLNKKTGELFANEINTLPGTLYHHLWNKSGIEISEVLEKMLKNGFLRWKESQKINNDFSTDVLNNANQLKLQMPK
ncbi:MAG: D-alanine--D-alanine ligase [Patescibacteria group bacterium]|nr:D-alanine--D-alanine ligase [Patescibacteria group bacterium]